MRRSDPVRGIPLACAGLFLAILGFAADAFAHFDLGNLTAETSVDQPSDEIKITIAKAVQQGFGRAEDLFEAVEYLFILRKNLIGILWDYRYELGTELVKMGETLTLPAYLDVATQAALPMRKFPEFHVRHHLVDHEVQVDMHPVPPDPQDLNETFEHFLRGALIIFDYDRQIARLMAKREDILYPPEELAKWRKRNALSRGQQIGLPAPFHPEAPAAAELGREIASLRLMQRHFDNENHLLFTPVEGWNDPDLRDCCVIWSEVKLFHVLDLGRSSESPPLLLYEKLVPIALQALGVPDLETYVTFDDISDARQARLRNLPPTLREVARKNIVDAYRIAMEQNEVGLTIAYRMQEASWVEQWTMGLMGRPGAAELPQEPVQFKSGFTHLLRLIPFFENSVDILRSIEEDYGIPVGRQKSLLATLMVQFRQSEEERERADRNAQTLGTVAFVGALPLSLWFSDSIALGLGFGIANGIFFHVVRSDNIWDAVADAKLSRSLFFQPYSEGALPLQLETLDRYEIMEREAWTEYWGNIAFFAADLAGSAYLQFARNGRLFGRSALALSGADMEKVGFQLKTLVEGLERSQEVLTSAADIKQFRRTLGRIRGGAIRLAQRLKTDDLPYMEQAEVAFHRKRKLLDGQISKLRTTLRRDYGVEIPTNMFGRDKVGKTRSLFGLGYKPFRRWLDPILELLPADLRSQAEELYVRRWAIERSQIRLGPLTSPRNHPTVVAIANQLKKLRIFASLGEMPSSPIRAENAIAAAEETVRTSQGSARLAAERVSNFLKSLWTGDFDFFRRFRGRYVNKGTLRRIWLSTRDQLLFVTPAEAGMRAIQGDNSPQEWPELVLNFVVGSLGQGVARGWASRANITLRRRIAIGGAFTFGAATAASLTLNLAMADDFGNDCLAAVLKRGAGQGVWSLLEGEPKARGLEAVKLAVERTLGKSSGRSALILTGITVAEKVSFRWAWKEVSQASGLEGNCARDLELLASLRGAKVLDDPDQDLGKALNQLRQSVGARFDKLSDLLLPPPPPAGTSDFLRRSRYPDGETR